jgi:hypothetical protein
MFAAGQGPECCATAAIEVRALRLCLAMDQQHRPAVHMQPHPAKQLEVLIAPAPRATRPVPTCLLTLLLLPLPLLLVLVLLTPCPCRRVWSC